MYILLCNIYPSYIKLIGQLLSASHLPGGGELCDERNMLDLNVYITYFDEMYTGIRSLLLANKFLLVYYVCNLDGTKSVCHV